MGLEMILDQISFKVITASHQCYHVSQKFRQCMLSS